MCWSAGEVYYSSVEEEEDKAPCYLATPHYRGPSLWKQMLPVIRSTGTKHSSLEKESPGRMATAKGVRLTRRCPGEWWAELCGSLSLASSL